LRIEIKAKEIEEESRIEINEVAESGIEGKVKADAEVGVKMKKCKSRSRSKTSRGGS